MGYRRRVYTPWIGLALLISLATGCGGHGGNRNAKSTSRSIPTVHQLDRLPLDTKKLTRECRRAISDPDIPLAERQRLRRQLALGQHLARMTHQVTVSGCALARRQDR